MKNSKEIQEVVLSIVGDVKSKFYTEYKELNVHERLLLCSEEILEQDGNKLSEIEYEFLKTIVKDVVKEKRAFITNQLNKHFELWITDFTELFPVTVPKDLFLSMYSDEEIKEWLKGCIDNMLIERI